MKRFSKSYCCLPYTRTCKERWFGNPPMPNNLCAYTLRLPPSNDFSSSDVQSEPSSIILHTLWSFLIKTTILQVLATGPGNPPAVLVLTGGSVLFGSRPGQKPYPLCLGGFVTSTGHRSAGIWPGWNRTAVPIIRFLLVWLQLSIWVLIVSWHSQYINCSALAPLSPPASKFANQLIFVEWLWNDGWF